MPNNDSLWTLLSFPLFNTCKYMGTRTSTPYLLKQESWNLIRDVFPASCFLFTNNTMWEVEKAAALFKAD